MSGAPISLIVGTRNLTDSYSDLSFTNVDPGGFEQLQATITDIGDVKVGGEVVVRCGMETAWHGRVNELGQRHTNGRTITQLAAVGYSAKLTDERMSMVYVDRDLSHWTGASRGRNVALVAGTYMQAEGPVVMIDTASSLPALQLQHADQWTSPRLPVAETWYDAGTGNKVGSVYYDFTNVGNASTADANWDLNVRTSSDDIFSTIPATSGDIWASVPLTGTLIDATGTRYAVVSFAYAATPGGAVGYQYGVHLRTPAVYGNHGLTKRGSAPQGYYPGDIAGHAHTLSGAGFTTVISDTSTFTVRHAAYRELVTHQQVITDMATLMGWHWGVWEPADILASTPRLFFTAPPTVATVAISRDRITDLDSPRVRVDRLYDTASVKWQDPAGTSGVTTVTTTNPLASGAGVAGRTLELDMGQGDSTTATSFGTFALALALAGARGGGSGTVPASIAGPYGARRPACLLRSGRDRIRITDLPDSGPLPESDANRQDSFLVRRVETTVKNGQPVTRIEFDGGADLLDVLSARLALAQIAGA